MGKSISVTLVIWRQLDAVSPGKFETYQMDAVDTDSSFLEMLDQLNEILTVKGIAPVAFESDCREGICGACGCMVDGHAHGPMTRTTLCQLHMRHFSDGARILLEPFRGKAIPVIRDLMVDRSAFDAIIAAGGYVSIRTGSAPDANAMLVDKASAETAFDFAQCIGCAACVAACPNASAMLFVGAKISHLAALPQGQPERNQRVRAMVATMDLKGFGNCSNTYECEAACPKGIKISGISQLNADYRMASLA